MWFSIEHKTPPYLPKERKKERKQDWNRARHPQECTTIYSLIWFNLFLTFQARSQWPIYTSLCTYVDQCTDTAQLFKMTQSSSCVESFLEVSLKSTRKTEPPPTEPPEEALGGGGGRFQLRNSSATEYGVDGEIIKTSTLNHNNFSSKQRAFEIDEAAAGGGFANKILTEMVRLCR